MRGPQFSRPARSRKRKSLWLTLPCICSLSVAMGCGSEGDSYSPKNSKSPERTGLTAASTSGESASAPRPPGSPRKSPGPGRLVDSYSPIGSFVLPDGTLVSDRAIGAFHAYESAVSGYATGAKIIFDAEDFDFNNWYNPATGNYTPQVQGLYRFTWLVTAQNIFAADTYWIADLMKNGSVIRGGIPVFQRGGGIQVRSGGSGTVRANGSTDNFSVRLNHGAGGAQDIFEGEEYTFLSGELIGLEP